MNGANQSTQAWLMQWGIILVFIFLMYFILIRPQRKKDKEVADMRSSLAIGDEIVTIGGICGRIIKVTDDSVVIQGGADKTKFEIKKWAVSTVEKKAPVKANYAAAAPEPEEKKVKPKRLGKKAEEVVAEAENTAETAVENATEAAAETTGFDVE